MPDTETNTAWFHVHEQSKRIRVKWWFPGAGGGDEEELLITGHKVSVK